MKKQYLTLLTGLFLIALIGPAGAAAQSGGTVYVLTVDDAITSAVGDYIGRGIELAEDAGAAAVVIRLNTPGGDVNTTIGIMEDLENAQVPVIVHVWPRGGMAASAGTLIMLAAHGAAVAPRTTIGAVHPIVTGAEAEVSEEQIEKLVNVLVEHAGLFAERRGEEAVDWAERSIRESATASPDEALELGVIDLIADDLDEVLAEFDGRRVTLGSGRSVVFETAGAEVVEVPMSFIERLLSMLINPNVAFILLAIGVQAILIEISAPGGWVAGFIGALCLALAAYAMGVLSFNWLGLILVAIAFVLFVLDVKAPTHGALTAAGVGTLAAGALVLFNSPTTSPYGSISVPLVISVALVMGLFFAFVVAKALQAQRSPAVTGKEGLIGRRGVVKVALKPEGTVLVAGERWRATSDEGELEVGQTVEVTAVEGFSVRVKRAE